MLRGARTPEDRASALLLGALLSGEGTSVPETVVPEVEEPEQEEVVEVRVTAIAEVKAYLEGERLGFAPATYAPRLHFFKPVGMTSYTPVRDDYPEDLLLRDPDQHISSGWTKVKIDSFNP